jgi:isopenicillin N synthase-like dioxygenase
MARLDRPDCVENGEGAGAYNEDGIPVVDFDGLINGDSDQRLAAILHLGRPCTQWGFFMVRTNVRLKSAAES